MREVSMTEFVKAHAAGAAVIDVGDVEEPACISIPVAIRLRLAAAHTTYTGASRRVLGGTHGWVKAGHAVVGGDHVRH